MELETELESIQYKDSYSFEKENGEKVTVTLNPNKFEFKVDIRQNEYKKRDRMKITFKLNQDETAAWNQFVQYFKPKEGISNEEFVKAIFLMGASTIESRAIEAAQELKRQEAAKAVEQAQPVLDPNFNSELELEELPTNPEQSI